MVFFVFFRVGERNVFFLSFIVLVVVVMEGEESSTRGDVMPMISPFLYYLLMGDVMFAFGSTSVFFEIHIQLYRF